MTETLPLQIHLVKLNVSIKQEKVPSTWKVPKQRQDEAENYWPTQMSEHMSVHTHVLPMQLGFHKHPSKEVVTC